MTIRFVVVPFLIGIIVMASSIGASAQDTLKVSDLLDMDLAEILGIEAISPAAITNLSASQVPAAISTISKEDILNTPARNIYDIMETYVPGAIWVSHEEGPHMGFRGIISNKNYKYLLLVNGRVMNSKAHFGAKSELESWNLYDIERIEIVRGPGSVTYGPGATGGVINIITKRAVEHNQLELRTGYVQKYNSKSLSASYGYLAGDFKLYAHSSVVRTTGFTPNHYLVTSGNQFGAIGRDIKTSDTPKITLQMPMAGHR